MGHAKASSGSSRPHSVSPLYPKPEGMGFTGRFYNVLLFRQHKDTGDKRILQGKTVYVAIRQTTIQRHIKQRDISDIGKG